LFSDLKGGRQTVKPKSFYRIVTVALFILILFFSLQAFAEEKKILRFQGSVMEIDLRKGVLMVNEEVFIWDKKTIFLNESGTPVTPDLLKVDQKVYIEGERLGRRKGTLIKELHLLGK
jgi:hypothetical protein